MYKTLRELVETVEIYRGFKRPEWRLFTKQLNQEQAALFLTIYENRAKEDTIIGQHFHNRVKLDLLKRLSNLLVCKTKTTFQNRIRKDRQRVHHRYYCMILLKDSGYSHSANWFAKTNIKEAMRLDMTSIVIETARYIARLYSTVYINPREGSKYNQICLDYQALLVEEVKIESLYNNLICTELGKKTLDYATVSYTHLTLPTIYSV